jgi:hypothetical protein
MFNINTMPTWKRRLCVAIVSVLFLAATFWIKHSTEDVVISMVLICIANFLPFRTEEEVQENKS